MSQSKTKKNPFLIWVITLIAVVVVGALWYANYCYLVSDNQRGTFGDMFGAVNSVFSGLAFAGIIITIFLQSRELKLQREELQETREEFKIQNKTLRLQRFENTFFSMLSLHHDIVNNINWLDEQYKSIQIEHTSAIGRKKVGEKLYTGRDVFEKLYKAIYIELRRVDSQPEIDECYMSKYYNYQNDFDHYFKNLYRIIKLIDTTQFTNDIESDEEFQEKYKYTSIIRAQLSAFELLWIFYNCLSENGFKKFKDLIEKYTLFKSFRFDELAARHHKGLYEKSAFEKPE